MNVIITIVLIEIKNIYLKKNSFICMISLWLFDAYMDGVVQGVNARVLHKRVRMGREKKEES